MSTAAEQSGFFDGELQAAFKSAADRDRQIRAERERRLEERRAVILAETAAWKTGPFAERIEALLGAMVNAGDAAKGMHDAILNGINTAAKANRLDERHVAFVEGKAREEVAKVGLRGSSVEMAWRERSREDLAAVAIGCVQLPEPIQAAALARLNTLGPSLGKLGFAHEHEVDGRASPQAREIRSEISNVYSSLMLIAGQRYRVEMGHKNVNPDRLGYFEDFATASLGIDTRQHPGVKTDVALTADGKERTTDGLSKRVVLSKTEKLAAAQNADTGTGYYIGKIVAADSEAVVQKFGRRTEDLVKHDRAHLEGGADIATGDVVTIRYAMGVGEVMCKDPGRDGPGASR